MNARRAWIRIPLALAAALGLAGCRDAASSGAATDAGAVAPAPSATPERVCSAGAERCASEGEAEACAPDGMGWERATCPAESVCLGGRCVSLGGVARERLLAVGGEGWLNGWSGAWPLFAKAVEPFVARPDDLFSPGTPLGFRPLCAPGGFVTALAKPDRRPPAPTFALLGGYLVADRARPVRFKIGPAGGLRIWLNGALLADVARPGRPFKDELIAAAELREGVNRIAIALEQADDSAAGLWLRVHDPESRVPPLLFAPASPAATCGLAELTAIDARPEPVTGGFEVTVRPRLAGLGPRSSPDLDVRAELARESGKPAGPVAASRARVSLAELSGGAPALTLGASPPRPGKHTLGVRIGPARLEVPLVSRGEHHDRIAGLRARLAEVPPGAIPQASRDSLELHVRTVTQALADGHPDLPWLLDRAAEADRLVAIAREGRDPYAGKTGIVHRAYRSELDGELQRYVLFVPRSHEQGKPLPLIVTAHGLGRLPEHALRTVIGEAPDEDMEIGWAARHLPPFPDQRAILAAPYTFGNAGPRPLGEHDVLRVIEEVKAHYRVDDRRVSITGASLGGTVAFVVPLHYPDLFSAAAPLCGYPDLTNHDSIRAVPHTPWEDAMIARRYIVNYAENGQHLPLHIVHGGKDGPGRSAVVADRYRALGYARVFDVQDELDHNVWDYAYEDGRMIEWLKARRRPDVPARVRFVTGEHRYDRSHWVRLVAMQPDRPPASLAEIDAEHARGEGRVRVTTRHVAALALDLGALARQGAGEARPASGGAGIEVVIDGATISVPDPRGEAFFERAEGSERFVRVPVEPLRPGAKRPGVAGPLDDVLRHPQLIVYGTQDPAQTETNRLVADHFSSYDMWASARFPIKADTEVADAELAGRSIVLIGGPASNRVTAALIAALPVRFEPGAVTVRGVRHEGDDVGVSLIHPSPRDPAQYVVLHAGVGYEGTLASRHLPRFAPDYLVYDARITTRRAENLLGDRGVRAGGFFDERWR